MYFQELAQKYTSRWWYIMLRGLVTAAIGIVIIVLPGLTLVTTMLIVGIGLIIDAAIIALPILLGRTTPHLWKIVLTREVVQILAGLIFIFHPVLGIEIVLVLLGLLVLFRGILELIVLTEAQTTVRHRRWLLVIALAFIVVGIFTITGVSLGTEVLIDLVGVYILIEGLTHILSAFRRQSFQEELAQYETAILSHEGVSLPSSLTQLDKPQPRTKRSFLFPHLDTDKYRKIVILTPHPDDLEGFVGGLAYRLSGEVISVIFSGGDKGVWSKEYSVMETDDYIRVRLEESDTAALLLGVDEINYLGYLDRSVPMDEDSIRKVLAQFEHHQPDLVVSFEYLKRFTPYPHPDHLATANTVRHAVARYNADHALDYVVVSTLIPNSFLDVSGVRRIKLQALACHTTQADLNSLIFPFLEKLFSHLWGIFVGADYAEGYRRIDITRMREKLDNAQ